MFQIPGMKNLKDATSEARCVPGSAFAAATGQPLVIELRKLN